MILFSYFQVLSSLIAARAARGQSSQTEMPVRRPLFRPDVFAFGTPHDSFDAFCAVHRLRQRQLRLFAGEADEISHFGEWPVEPGRRHLEPFEIDVLDCEETGQMVRNPRAVFDVDAIGLVDEHADELAPGRDVDVDQLVAQRGHRSLQQFTDVRVHAST